jgi:hypothetical protein
MLRSEFRAVYIDNGRREFGMKIEGEGDMCRIALTTRLLITARSALTCATVSVLLQREAEAARAEMRTTKAEKRTMVEMTGVGLISALLGNSGTKAWLSGLYIL